MASPPKTAPSTASDPVPPKPGPRDTGGNVLRLGALLSPNRVPNEDELDDIDEVRSLAREFDGSALKLGIVRRTTTGQQRFLATRFTPRSHPDFVPLMRLLDALIADEDLVTETNHGPFLKSDIIAAEARIEREDGQEVISFPISHPWAKKPDPKKGDAGIRAPAIYRSREARKHGPERGTFQVQPKAPAPERNTKWWEKET